MLCVPHSERAVMQWTCDKSLITTAVCEMKFSTRNFQFDFITSTAQCQSILVEYHEAHEQHSGNQYIMALACDQNKLNEYSLPQYLKCEPYILIEWRSFGAVQFNLVEQKIKNAQARERMKAQRKSNVCLNVWNVKHWIIFVNIAHAFQSNSNGRVQGEVFVTKWIHQRT